MDVTTIIGFAGMGLILIAFTLNVFKYFPAQSKIYLWMNIIGSCLLIWYSLLENTVPFLVLNTVWVGAAVWGLIRHR